LLLTGPVLDVNFESIYFHLDSMFNAPDLFVDDSPLLLLAMCLQRPGAVKVLLAKAGLGLENDMNALAAGCSRSSGRCTVALDTHRLSRLCRRT
jgi:hypothetical protein